MNYLCFYKRPILHLGTRFHPLLPIQEHLPHNSPLSPISSFSPVVYWIIPIHIQTQCNFPHLIIKILLESHIPLQLSPHLFVARLWKCYLCWLSPLPFLPFPLTPSIQGPPPHTHNYSTKTAIMKITHGFCISKSKVSSQISSYLSYHHHLTLLIPPSPLIPSLSF